MSQSNQVGQSSTTTKNASSSSNSRRRKPDYEGLLHPSPGNDSVANRLINAGYVVVRSPLPLSLNHQVEESEEDPRQGQVHNNISKHTAPCSSDASPLLLFSGAPLFIPQGSSSYPCWSSLYRIEISPELLKLVDGSIKSSYRLKGPGGPKVVKHIFDYMMTVQCGHRRNSSSTSLAIYFDSDRIHRSSRRLVNAPLSMHAAICGHKTSTVLSTWDMSREDEWDIIFQASHPDPSQRFGCYSRLHDHEEGLKPQPFFTKLKNLNTNLPIEKSALFFDRPLPALPETSKPCRCVKHNDNYLCLKYLEEIPTPRNANHTVLMERWDPKEFPDPVVVRYREPPEDSQEEVVETGVELTGFEDNEPSSDGSSKANSKSDSDAGDSSSCASSSEEDLGAGNEWEAGDDASSASTGEEGEEDEQVQYSGIEEAAWHYSPSLHPEESDSEVDGKESSFEGGEAEDSHPLDGSFSSSRVASEDGAIQVATSDFVPTPVDDNPLSLFYQHLNASGLPENVQNELSRILTEGNSKIAEDIKDTTDKLIQCYADYYSQAMATTSIESSSSKRTICLENGSSVSWSKINTEVNALTEALATPVTASLATILGLLPHHQTTTHTTDSDVAQSTLPLEGLIKLSAAAPDDSEDHSGTFQEIAHLDSTTVSTTTLNDMTAATSSPEHEAVDYNGVPNYSDEVTGVLESIEIHSELDAGIGEGINGYNHNFE